MQINIWNLSNSLRMARLLVVKIIYFYMIFFRFAAATSLVSEANKLSEKVSLQTKTIFKT